LKDEPEYLRAGLVDFKTGEVLPGVLVQKEKRHQGGRNWIVVYIEKLRQVASDPDFGEQSLRLLLYFMSELGMNNRWVTFNQNDLAFELKMCRQNVNRAIKVLVKKGLLLQGSRVGRGYAYALNHGAVWRGKLEECPKTHPPLYLNGKTFLGNI
jgi:hypothetical protein